MHYFYEREGLELNYFNRKTVLTFVLEMQHYTTLHWEHFYKHFFFFLNNNASSAPAEQTINILR